MGLGSASGSPSTPAVVTQVGSSNAYTGIHLYNQLKIQQALEGNDYVESIELQRAIEELKDDEIENCLILLKADYKAMATLFLDEGPKEKSHITQIINTFPTHIQAMGP